MTAIDEVAQARGPVLLVSKYHSHGCLSQSAEGRCQPPTESCSEINTNANNSINNGSSAIIL